jgi:uncharacterized protein
MSDNNQNQSNRGFASMDDDKQRDIARKGGENSNQGNSDTSNRGFASMDEDKQRQIARKGGESVPDEKRSFSQDHELASEAGRKGGENSHNNQHNS